MSVSIKDICFSYEDKLVLDHVSLKVSTGEHVGVLGVSGGGKSTLLKLIAGLYTPDTGLINVNGATDPIAIRQNIALVMQTPMLLPMSIYDNVTCGHEAAPGQVTAALEAARLTDWIATLPDGEKTFVGERGSKVSGGQAQRIAIARAIFKDAPVVLLDEATSALDAETGEAVLKALYQLTIGKTVISVTHKPETLAGYDRVYHLREGRLSDA